MVTSKKLIRELSQAPSDKLSLHAVAKDVEKIPFQAESFNID